MRGYSGEAALKRRTALRGSACTQNITNGVFCTWMRDGCDVESFQCIPEQSQPLTAPADDL